MQNFVATIVEYLILLCPFRVITIYPFEQGVLFRGGQVNKVCTYKNGLFGSGMHFFWCWWESITQVGTAETVNETQFQTVQTKDAIELTVSLAVTSKVVDPVAYSVNVMDVLDSLENLCQGALAGVVSMSDYDNIRSDYTQLGEQVLEQLQEKGEDWGVDFLQVNIVNFTVARALRLLQDPGNGFTIS
jgi:regulator of protease activity HflC (stomatin/prohibitin superfamily)